MSPLSDDQDLFGNPFATEVLAPCIWWPNDDAIGWPIDLPQTTITQDSFHTWTHENTLGMSEIYGSELLSDQFASASAIGVSFDRQSDVDCASATCLHQPSPTDTATHFWQLPLPYDASVPAAWDTAISHPIPQSPVPKSISCSQRKRISTSRPLTLSSMASRSRYAPYPPGPDSTRRAALSASLYRCQWYEGGSPCGAVLTGTKNAIGQHLQLAHAIRVKADKTTQVCLWDRCQKSMRRDNIPRHVLAVHMGDKALCSNCGSQFARPDSLRRHERTCLAKGEDASDAYKAGEGPLFL